MNARRRQRAERTAALLRVLGEPTRLLLLAELGREPRSAGELAAAVAADPGKPDLTGVLRHLDRLVAGKLAVRRKEGRTAFYRLADGAVTAGVLRIDGCRVPLPTS